jgi:hypothetical protein
MLLLLSISGARTHPTNGAIFVPDWLTEGRLSCARARSRDGEWKCSVRRGLGAACLEARIIRGRASEHCFGNALPRSGKSLPLAVIPTALRALGSEGPRALARLSSVAETDARFRPAGRRARGGSPRNRRSRRPGAGEMSTLRAGLSCAQRAAVKAIQAPAGITGASAYPSPLPVPSRSLHGLPTHWGSG